MHFLKLKQKFRMIILPVTALRRKNISGKTFLEREVAGYWGKAWKWWQIFNVLHRSKRVLRNSGVRFLKTVSCACMIAELFKCCTWSISDMTFWKRTIEFCTDANFEKSFILPWIEYFSILEYSMDIMLDRRRTY